MKKEIDIIFFAPSQAPSRQNIISISSYTEGKEFIKNYLQGNILKEIPSPKVEWVSSRNQIKNLDYHLNSKKIKKYAYVSLLIKTQYSKSSQTYICVLKNWRKEFIKGYLYGSILISSYKIEK